jgi:hypothetical protein
MKDKWLDDMDNEAIYEQAREEGRVIVIGDYAIWDLNHEQFGIHELLIVMFLLSPNGVMFLQMCSCVTPTTGD